MLCTNNMTQLVPSHSTSSHSLLSRLQGTKTLVRTQSSAAKVGGSYQTNICKHIKNHPHMLDRFTLSITA